MAGQGVIDAILRVQGKITSKAKAGRRNMQVLTAYPATLCWKPHQDQTPSEISFNFTAYERYADQLRDDNSPPESPTPDPPAPEIVEPATVSEREVEHEQK
jgi:hypothetical protein